MRGFEGGYRAGPPGPLPSNVATRSCSGADDGLVATGSGIFSEGRFEEVPTDRRELRCLCRLRFRLATRSGRAELDRD